ncbi:YitT family protein [Rhizobium halophytocola]|uniref:Uncharacterized membrane-anchored protein YitT (DUF2179 family) n=1 Tax=Rhizobium halophytocola TaxID=735519 RepID=A0ABS4E0A6_9HYPH|nr:YitT family protein [Rhizobium halophytocola]MBP1851366.1 uncharacterized membrane-anchored protein YitT (DUF2179 family) [Rhizobium halophytocola]
MAMITDIMAAGKKNPARHTPLEDIQGILSGSMISALGLFLLGKVELLTGGMAGAAFLLHYWGGWSFGVLFFLLNMPFYILAFKRVGLDFTLKTFLAIGLTSGLVELQSRFISIQWMNPVWAAALGGLLLGYGLLALYRHRASLGGIGILAVYIQDRFGIRAGFVQLVHDLVIMALAFTVVSPEIVACSVLGAAVMNLFVAINHRSDRYIAQR